MNNKSIIFSIEIKIKSVVNYNGQLATIQTKTQEATTLIRFAIDNELINEEQAKELFEELKDNYNKAISSASFEKIIQW